MRQISDHPEAVRYARAFHRLPQLHAETSGRGFAVLRALERTVEELRVRPEDELSFVGYLSEVAVESTYLTRGTWGSDLRAALPAAARSRYLDMLQARRLAGAADYSTNAGSNVSLDPNECRYIGLQGGNDRLWKRHLDEALTLKNRDVEQWRDSIVRFSSKGTSVTPPAVKAFIKSACEHYRFEVQARKVDGENQLFIFRRLGSGISCGANWGDMANFFKWGRLAMSFRLEYMGPEDLAPVVLFTKRLGQLLPGGDLYMWHNQAWPSMCLGFLLAFNFLDAFVTDVQ